MKFKNINKNTLHIPMDENCKGALILGTQIQEQLFSLIAVKIPYGFV